MKCCTKCKELKPVSSFSKDKYAKDGYCFRCVDCCSAARNIWRLQNLPRQAAVSARYRNKHPERVQKSQKEWRQNNPETVQRSNHSINTRFLSARRGAIKRGIEWAITLSEFSNLCSKACVYCNGHFPPVIAGSGLDRLDNNLGYVLENITSCCTHCNLLKHTSHTPEETRAMVQLLIEMRRPKLHAVK